MITVGADDQAGVRFVASAYEPFQEVTQCFL